MGAFDNSYDDEAVLAHESRHTPRSIDEYSDKELRDELKRRKKYAKEAMKQKDDRIKKQLAAAEKRVQDAQEALTKTREELQKECIHDFETFRSHDGTDRTCRICGLDA